MLGALALLAAVALATSSCGFVEPALQPLTPEVLGRVAIPPVDGRTAQFDIIAVDQAGHRLYIADSVDEGVDVVDISVSPGRYLRTIPLGTPTSGLAFDPGSRILFASKEDSSVAVIQGDVRSPQAYKVLRVFSTGGKGPADLLTYDPKDHKLFVTNPDDAFMTSIDVRTGKLLRRYVELSFVEQPVYDAADGMIYLDATDRNSLIQIDPRREAIVGEYPLPVVCEPHGLAINPKTNQGLVGCGDKDNQVTVAWDFKTKQSIGISDFAGAGDALIFDAVADHFYFAAASFNPPEIAVFNGYPITFLTAVPTSHRSGTVGYDEMHHAIYTYDGRHLEASLWTFPDPVAGCVGTEAVLAAHGASRHNTPNCHPALDNAAKLGPLPSITPLGTPSAINPPPPGGDDS